MDEVYKKKIVFVSEYAPLKSKGSGISVLLYNIITALNTFDISLVTFCSDSKVSAREIMDDNYNYETIICDKNFYKLYRGKFARFYNDFLVGISFIFSLKKIGDIINNPNTLVVMPIGISAKPLWKFLILKYLFRKAKHGLYIVDDLELINLKLANKVADIMTKVLLPTSIRKSDFLITISYGLSDSYFKRYKKQSYTLLPHFSEKQPLIKKQIESNFMFLFTGGLNFLYNKSLLQLAKLIDEINIEKKNKINLSLKIQTYSSETEFIQLGFKAFNAIYSTVSNRNDLDHIYKNCHCFIVPYSFDMEDKPIVETSFPQKVAEIIQYGRPILVFSPSYSSISQFFINNDLNYVCNERSDKLIKDTLLKIVNEYNYGNQLAYKTTYDDFLSAKMVSNVFFSIYNSVIINEN